MRARSENVKTLLQGDETQLCFLVKIVTPNTTLLDTNYTSTITVPGVGAFVPTGGLITVEAPRLSEIVDRESYKISYTDPAFEKIAMFEDVLTGSRVTVYVCFINTTLSILGGAQPGQPLTNLDDMLIAYEGVVDTQGYTAEPAEGKIIAVIECSSPVAALGLSRAFYTSKEGMKQYNAADTSFDQVYAGSAKVAVPWGKAA